MRKYIMPTIIPVPKKLNVLLATRVYAFVSSTTVINDTNDESFSKEMKSLVRGGSINENACGSMIYRNVCH